MCLCIPLLCILLIMRPSPGYHQGPLLVAVDAALAQSGTLEYLHATGAKKTKEVDGEGH
jgi:hypothetical protein